MPTDAATTGRLLGLDLGEKRIGVAVSDEARLLARAHSVLRRRSRREDFARLAAIIAAENVTGLVVGLPLQPDGDDARLAWIRDYARHLSATLELPVVLHDESFSTADAAASLSARGVNARRQKERLDAVAAAFILQRYLDTLSGRDGAAPCSPHDAAPPL